MEAKGIVNLALSEAGHPTQTDTKPDARVSAISDELVTPRSTAERLGWKHDE